MRKIIMKKIFVLATSAIAAILMISCNKAQQPGNDNQGIKVNITVGNLEPSTKAVKTGWTTGDIINVFLNDKEDYAPDFTLTYDGSKWNASELSATVISALEAKPNGIIKGFWEQSNGTGIWKKDSYYWDAPDFDKKESTGTEDYLIAHFNDISYTYSSETLTANINTWTFTAPLQIVVNGIDYEKGRYTLWSTSIASLSSIRIFESKIEIGIWGSGSEARITGIPNSDGVAFVGKIKSDGASPQEIYLHLIDNKESKSYIFHKSDAVLYSAANTKICAIKIPFSKFSND